jgi:hypothetical protein
MGDFNERILIGTLMGSPSWFSTWIPVRPEDTSFAWFYHVFLLEYSV